MESKSHIEGLLDGVLYLIWQMLPLRAKLALSTTNKSICVRCLPFMKKACKRRLTRWTAKTQPRLSMIVDHQMSKNRDIARGAVKSSRRLKAQKALLTFMADSRSVAILQISNRYTSYHLMELTKVMEGGAEFTHPRSDRWRVHRYCFAFADFRHTFRNSTDCYLCNHPRSPGYQHGNAAYDPETHIDLETAYDVILRKQ